MRRRRVLTPQQQADKAEFDAYVESHGWECPHGVRCGSLARPRPFYGPRCPYCRAAGWTRWRRLDTIQRIPEAYL